MPVERAAPRLLVGLAEADVTMSREYLVALLRGLSDFHVEVQVAMFEDGPLRPLLEDVADVRVLPSLPHRSPGGIVQSLARRVSGDLADRVHDRRVAAERSWIRSPDGIFVHGPLATPILRYERSSAAVNTYCHPWDFSIAGLSPLDLSRVLARTGRFLIADPGTFGGTVVDDLVAAGADPTLIHIAPDELDFPAPPSPDRRAAIRRRLGLGPDEVVVAVLPVVDWVDSPDLTLSLVWELERLAGDRAPVVLWYGMPTDGDRRWPIDYDVERMGLTSLRISGEDLSWDELVSGVDVVSLPIRTTSIFPAAPAEAAADRATPLLCWDGHELADAVALWGGEVVPRGDVAAMAASIWSMVEDEEALRRARSVGWRLRMADIDGVSPVEVPLP